MAASEPLDARNSWAGSIRLAGLLFLNALALFPLLLTGYCGDDIFNSQIRGEMIQTHRSLWQVISFYASAWMQNEGRFFPLAFTNFAVFYVFRSVLLYKLAVLALVLAGLAAFYLFLRKLTGTRALPDACLILLPLFVQFRAVWDPVLGFAGQYPLMTLGLFTSLLLFLKYIDEGSVTAQSLAILIFLCCGLLFETSYLLCLLYGVVAFSRLRDWRAAFRRAWPYFAVATALVLISFVMKKRALAPNPAYVPNLDPVAIVKGYLIQSFAAIPFSYFILDPAKIFSDSSHLWTTSIAIGLPLLILLAALVLFASRRTWFPAEEAAPKAQAADILAFGFLLFALPQALISLSTRYQAMAWGNSYIPVYLSRMGLALLVAVLLLPLLRRTLAAGQLRPRLACVLAVVWLALFGLNLRNNFLVAAAENRVFWDSRTLLESSLRHGLLADVPPGSVLLVSGSYLWEIANEYSAFTGREYAVHQLSQPSELLPDLQRAGGACRSADTVRECTFAAGNPVYSVQIRHLGDGVGAVVLTHVTRVVQAGDQVRTLLATASRVFVRYPDSTPRLAPNIVGTQFSQPQARGIAFHADQAALDSLKSGRGWELFSFRSGPQLDALSLQAYFSPELPHSVTVSEKDPASFELHPAGSVFLHTGYAGGDLGSGVVKPALPTADPLSIEVLATPGDQQVVWADILSNHGPGFGGFAIEQRAAQTNCYSVVFGDGKAWIEVGQLQLTPGNRHYISIQVSGKDVELYLDGQLVAHKLLPSLPASSPHGLSIGNWVGGGRPFNGLIEEVAISRENRSSTVIAADAARLHLSRNGQSTDTSHPSSGKTP